MQVAIASWNAMSVYANIVTRRLPTMFYLTVTRIQPKNTIVRWNHSQIKLSSIVRNEYLATLLKHVLSGHTTTMSIASENSWYFNYGCCNHMTLDLNIFSYKHTAPHTTSINTADGSQLHVNHTRIVHTSKLSLLDTFNIWKLIINLIFDCQLFDLILNVIFFLWLSCTGSTKGTYYWDQL